MIEGPYSEDTAHTVEDLFGGEVEDITWVTPVLEEHFTYHSSILAGRPLMVKARAAMILVVPHFVFVLLQALKCKLADRGNLPRPAVGMPSVHWQKHA